MAALTALPTSLACMSNPAAEVTSTLPPIRPMAFDWFVALVAVLSPPTTRLRLVALDVELTFEVRSASRSMPPEVVVIDGRALRAVGRLRADPDFRARRCLWMSHPAAAIAARPATPVFSAAAFAVCVPFASQVDARRRDRRRPRRYRRGCRWRVPSRQSRTPNETPPGDAEYPWTAATEVDVPVAVMVSAPLSVMSVLLATKTSVSCAALAVMLVKRDRGEPAGLEAVMSAFDRRVRGRGQGHVARRHIRCFRRYRSGCARIGRRAVADRGGRLHRV